MSFAQSESLAFSDPLVRVRSLGATLARTHGTPLYVYDAAVFRERVLALQKVFAPLDALVCFATKANSNLSILREFSKLGVGFDIVSEGELRKVQAAGGDPGKVVFAGVAKSREEMSYALSAGIRFFNIESASELRALEGVARAAGRPAPCCLRINPNVAASTHDYLTTGTSSNKFGIAPEEAWQLWQEFSRSPHIKLVGLDCHIGSQITQVAPFRQAYREVLRLAAEFTSRGASIETLDLGGGLGIAYSGHTDPLPLDEYAAMVRETLVGTPYRFVFEPGRFLIAEAGTLLTTVRYLKSSGPKTFAVCDAGMNDLIRPSLYEAWHTIENLTPSTGSSTVVDVVGPVCESGCFLAKERALPGLSEGAVLAVRDAGAYGQAMASSYNVRRLPAEVMIQLDGAPRLVRQREQYEDLWRAEEACL